MHKRTKPVFRQETPGIFFFFLLPSPPLIFTHFSCYFCSQMLPATCSLNIFFSQLASPFVLILGKVDSSRHSFIKPIQSEKLCPHTARKTTESQPSFSNLFLKAHQWLASSLTPKGKMRRKERYSPLIGTIPGHALYVATLRAPCYQLLGISVWCSRFCSSMGLGV